MIKKIFVSFLVLGFAVYLILAVTVFNKPKDNQTCTQVEIVVEDSINSGLINENDIKNYLIKKKLYPQGLTMKQIDLVKIEKKLKDSPYIVSAVCYKTASGSVNIKVKSLQVLLHIISDQGDNYYIDNEGKPVPKSSYCADKIIATGNITKQYAQQKLTPLGKIIQNDPFLENLIEQIHVLHDGSIELIPRIGNHTIYLGRPQKIKDKLNRLKIFYQKGINQVGWNKYSQISLEYENQIICKKNK